MNISDLNQETRDLCDADTTSYPAATLLRRINSAYEEIVGKIINSDGTWQFDDTNYTDLPIGSTNLVASQQDYTFASSHLEIERVEVKDAAGAWWLLDPIDKSAINWSLENYLATPGMPREYDKNGSSIFLYPAPSAASTTLTAGLKVYYKRSASLFTSGEVATGTKEPGFASPFHVLLAYKAAIPYCMTYKKDRIALYTNEATRLEKELMEFYGNREKDIRKGITSRPISFR